MTTLKASDTGLPTEALKEVTREGKRIRVTCKDGASVYLISARDHRMLRALEDRYWTDSGLAELARHEAEGGKGIPLEETLAKVEVAHRAGCGSVMDR